MIAIRVRYMHPTNRRGGRWQATDGRNYLYASFAYEDEAKEKLELANQFKLKFLPHSPELNPIPSQFDHGDYFGFYPKADRQKLDDLLSQFVVDNGIGNPRTAELIASFVMQHCVIK